MILPSQPCASRDCNQLKTCVVGMQIRGAAESWLVQLEHFCLTLQVGEHLENFE
jgi:hypothetical protein